MFGWRERELGCTELKRAEWRGPCFFVGPAQPPSFFLLAISVPVPDRQAGPTTLHLDTLLQNRVRSPHNLLPCAPACSEMEEGQSRQGLGGACRSQSHVRYCCPAPGFTETTSGCGDFIPPLFWESHPTRPRS
jgi:hypothetical protein